ncbi:MAG: hypothetical protein K8U57_26965 [Planctomycetes bacterium]|nr:hypothetical protein [Planctomycetota bacterium]
MGGLIFVIIAIVIISTIVGAVSKLFNNLNEMNNANAARQRAGLPPAGNKPAGGGGVVRQANSDMDRFLAEIDRLRKKTADTPPPAQKQAPAVPVVQPVKQPERSRQRVVAELADAPQKTDGGFTQSFPAATIAPRAGDIPTVTVTTPSSGTGAPATRVTRLASRPRPVAKTPFAKNLTGLLGSGQGLAMAIVLQEVLGPPRIKKKR